MAQNIELKEKILTLNKGLDALISEAANIIGGDSAPIGNWKDALEASRQQISKRIIHIAAVGTIKSGKSTFVNTLLGGDYLKRGAGVITSIVTRIRAGDKQKAEFFFKSWQEINKEMQHALTLFPSPDWRRDEMRPFDIRRQSDRDDLTQALETLDSGFKVVSGMLNPNSILLWNYLHGYQEVTALIAPEESKHFFCTEKIEAHRRYVSNDALSIYLKDICLYLKTPLLGAGIEIADCQGSDAPNPFHMGMVQRYLLETHLIFYVISSRTGLRRADLRFLSVIKKMGIIKNILFVINCDLSEHASLADLKTLCERIASELSLFTSKPRIFTLSALYNLFDIEADKLTRKDRARYEEWRKLEELTAFNTKETMRFMATFNRTISDERYAILFENHVQRLAAISAAAGQWVRVNRGIISKDGKTVRQAASKMEANHQRIRKLKAMIAGSIDGAVTEIRNECRTSIDSFFQPRSGRIVPEVIDFLKNWSLSSEIFSVQIAEKGFAQSQYLAYQEFTRALDHFMVEHVNPTVVHFVKDLESAMGASLESTLSPLDEMLHAALSGYHQENPDANEMHSYQKALPAVSLNMDMIRRNADIVLPPVVATPIYSRRARTQSTVRLGYYRAVRFFKKMIKRSATSDLAEERRALRDGISQIKRETEASIIFHFKSYCENLKFQYVFKLLDQAALHLKEVLAGRFQVYDIDLGKLAQKLEKGQMDSINITRILDELIDAFVKIDMELKNISGQIKPVNKEDIHE